MKKAKIFATIFTIVTALIFSPFPISASIYSAYINDLAGQFTIEEWDFEQAGGKRNIHDLGGKIITVESFQFEFQGLISTFPTYIDSAGNIYESAINNNARFVDNESPPYNLGVSWGRDLTRDDRHSDSSWNDFDYIFQPDGQFYFSNVFQDNDIHNYEAGTYTQFIHNSLVFYPGDEWSVAAQVYPSNPELWDDFMSDLTFHQAGLIDVTSVRIRLPVMILFLLQGGW